MKYHLIWDMDGTLVDSEPEILTTIQKALASVNLSFRDVRRPLKIGPPLPVMLRSAFDEKVLNDEKLQEVVRAFRKVYDTSEFEDTKPFEGIDCIIRSPEFVHYVITNKPFYATRRIIEKKGWTQFFSEVLSPDTYLEKMGRPMNKQELFQLFHNNHPDLKAIGIGDMAGDVLCAKTVGYYSIGVLWGTGTWEELSAAACDGIVASSDELLGILKAYRQ